VTATRKETEELRLAEAVTHLLEECRMVLPGVQALFGFQLIAVFNSGFSDRLSYGEQNLHLIALACVACAGALIMSPAAYHRQTNPRAVSAHFLAVGGRLLLISMVPLMTGIGLDFYLIVRIVRHDVGFAVGSAVALVLFFATCWFGLPRVVGRRHRVNDPKAR
jgi:hypothetical protein